MLRNGPAGSVTTTTSPDQRSEREIRRLRLTLRPEDPTGQKDPVKSTPRSEEKMVNGSWMKKNGVMQRERPPGRESPIEDKHSCGVSNGVGPRVYGVVQRTGEQQQQEVTAREWPVSHLRDEMRYIKEVRDSLEKVRERMYGQFGGMQQSVEKLSQELRMANSQKRYLEAEVKTGRQAMQSFDQMNSSLISANIDLQKALLESCNGRVGNREEMRALRSSFEKTEERLREREKQLAAAQAENQALKLQVESSQEASAQAMKEISAKLQQQYEEQLQEQQKKHRQEIEALQAQLEEYMRRLEAAERNVKLAEEKIAERDQRISELERLLDCMAQEKSQLTQKLCDCEKRLRTLDEVDSGVKKRTEQLVLQKEASELKERIKHLNDMVFCQQRKVKGMIEEVETLRASVAQKDMYISELLDRIAIVECENNELEDKLKYFMSVQNATVNKPLTREIGVGCDLSVRLPEKSGSSSPSQSSGSTTPLSSEARRLRDRKHLDDITAAKLPPLYHNPAQLLSLEESVALQREQTRKQQELQAKLAAQKLAEGLTVSMSSYNPEGGALAAYREVHDDGALSDED
ncbi:myocardial zonula adherens protein-like isoform X3 [Pygocentrus nattereri]|uniref:myocardial zonula adherens protein-like isoform X3 n=1 Tax=Pygocentrus nattereri TaxID=42514 RepID=UPI0008147DE9|nr:myocardial zonula adherens protein-like isoform X3 [Pygocentrus nattereri]